MEQSKWHFFANLKLHNAKCIEPCIQEKLIYMISSKSCRKSSTCQIQEVEPCSLQHPKFPGSQVQVAMTFLVHNMQNLIVKLLPMSLAPIPLTHCSPLQGGGLKMTAGHPLTRLRNIQAPMLHPIHALCIPIHQALCANMTRCWPTAQILLRVCELQPTSSPDICLCLVVGPGCICFCQTFGFQVP